MEKRPIIFVKSDGFARFCDNRCNNTKCKKHISNMVGFHGGAKIGKMRDTPDCEGYISKWKQSHAEIEQIKQDMREAGIEE